MGVGGGEREDKRERDMIPLQSIKNIEFSNHTHKTKQKNHTKSLSLHSSCLYLFQTFL